MQHVIAQRTKTFEGSIIVHMHGQTARKLMNPLAVTVLPSSKELWDANELMRAVRAVLPFNVKVEQAPMPWDDPSERDFCFSMTAMIMQAHSAPHVYITVRTIENTRRFAMLHVPDLIVPMALLGRGPIICAPTYRGDRIP